MSRFLDLTGRRFGRLLVLRQDPTNKKYSKYRWVCKCDCGKEKSVIGYCLTGGVKSCGCLLSETTKNRFTKHGGARVTNGKRNRAYITWVAMLDRCFNKTNKSYHNYGGRGITVCSRWRNNYLFFLKDMGQPDAGMTLDRVDNNGNYFPKNCRWVSQEENCNNKRTNHFIEWKGMRKSVSQWAKYLGVTRSSFQYFCVRRGVPISQYVGELPKKQ
jgi:hypothetical protein